MALTQVKTAGIAADAVTSAKVADDQIDSEHYIAASIDNEHLANNAVDTDGIADDAVTLAKMDGLARGKLIVGDASGNPSALAAGSDNYVLTMDSNGDAGWEAAAAGGAALTGSTNNTICTVTGANAIAGEAYLTFNGTGDLTVTGDENTAANLILVSDQSDNTADEWRLSSQVDNLFSIANDDSGSFVNKLELHKAGNVEVVDGNLVIGTSGHGIDFSATADGAGTDTSELLDDYEEGTFTPELQCSTTNPSYGGGAAGVYTKIGRQVTCSGYIDTNPLNSNGSGNLYIDGFPYGAANLTGNNVPSHASITT